MITFPSRLAVGAAVVLGLAGLGTGTSAAVSPEPNSQASHYMVAAATVNPQQGAVDWAKARLGQTTYEGLCLRFVVDAYSQGGGVDIGTAPSAVDYWNGHQAQQHPGDTGAPFGALVFWGATSANPYGHVGISLGDGTVISSYERSDHTIHIFAMADRNNAGYPYLGWMAVA